MAVESESSQTTTVGQEHTIFTGSEAKTYVGYIDLSPMQAGDVLVVKNKIKLSSGGNLRTITSRAYGYRVALREDCLLIPAVKNEYEYVITITQTLGSSRMFPFLILSV